jgi:Protein of unknown function (DUF2924)
VHRRTPPGPLVRLRRAFGRKGIARRQHAAGTRVGDDLVREWDGKSQRVMVLDQGFAWNGTTYRSLTQIAFAMTGTRWSGPRFFGLRSPEKPA